MKYINLKISVGYQWSNSSMNDDPRWQFLRRLCVQAKNSVERLSNDDLQIRVSFARLRCMHGGLMLPDLMRRIRESDILLFDIGQDNRNVYLEVGMALATRQDFRNVFLLAREGQNTPSDLQGVLLSYYQETAEYNLVDSLGFSAALRSSLRFVIESKYHLQSDEEES